MKLVPVLLLVAAIVFAAEEKKEEERPKTFRRLIPADVLRGESFYFSFFLHERFWNLKGLCSFLQYVYLNLPRAQKYEIISWYQCLMFFVRRLGKPGKWIWSPILTKLIKLCQIQKDSSKTFKNI